MKRILLLACVFTFFAAVAMAASPEAITSTVPAGTSIATLEDALIKGSAKTGWRTAKTAAGVMESTLQIRQHTVIVTITYSAASYTITYKDSTNMKYNADKNSIHNNYNKWVRNMDKNVYSLLVK
jgi:hypothetical protein